MRAEGHSALSAPSVRAPFGTTKNTKITKYMTVMAGFVPATQMRGRRGIFRGGQRFWVPGTSPGMTGYERARTLSWVSCLSWFLMLSACEKPAPAAPAALGLDCSQGFEAQSGRIVAQAGLVPAPKDPAEPYRFYSTADGASSYLITEPGAPGHPAIMMQQAHGHQVVTTGCPYGDRKGYAQLMAYLDGLKAWHRR